MTFKRPAYGSLELRTAEVIDLTARRDARASAGHGLRVSGIAAVYDVSTNIGPFSEEISRGAFAGVIRDRQPTIFAMNHDLQGWTLGNVRSGTLRLSDDASGLRFDADLPDTDHGRHVHELCRRGDLLGCSFGFSVNSGGDQWKATEDGRPHRIVRAVARLRDVGPVSLPAYPTTSYSANSAKTYPTNRRWVELQEMKGRHYAQLLEMMKDTA